MAVERQQMLTAHLLLLYLQVEQIESDPTHIKILKKKIKEGPTLVRFANKS